LRRTRKILATVWQQIALSKSAPAPSIFPWEALMNSIGSGDRPTKGDRANEVLDRVLEMRFSMDDTIRCAADLPEFLKRRLRSIDDELRATIDVLKNHLRNEPLLPAHSTPPDDGKMAAD
jgi:hypothetical protein